MRFVLNSGETLIEQKGGVRWPKDKNAPTATVPGQLLIHVATKQRWGITTTGDSIVQSDAAVAMVAVLN